MKNFDFDHLKNTKEGYFEHMLHAAEYSAIFASCALACMMHAIFPFLFAEYASGKAKEIVEHVNQRKGENNGNKEQ